MGVYEEMDNYEIKKQIVSVELIEDEDSLESIVNIINMDAADVAFCISKIISTLEKESNGRIDSELFLMSIIATNRNT